AGAFAGTWVNQRVSGPLILLRCGALMLVGAARRACGPKPPARPADFHRHPLAVPVAGLAVGLMTGFFGVGGGFLIVPALVLALGLPMRVAVGTSLVIIAINSASGIVAHLPTGGIETGVAAAFVLGGFIGSQAGGRLAGRIDDARLARGFAAMVAAIGVFLIVRNAGLVFGAGGAAAARGGG
ncbi:MAG: sulfite exporter TauE/SafE family protein, partial [Chloroflexota bacterium]